jgi:hypothetical protein
MHNIDSFKFSKKLTMYIIWKLGRRGYAKHLKTVSKQSNYIQWKTFKRITVNVIIKLM